jgi:hypothetical protein
VIPLRNPLAPPPGLSIGLSPWARESMREADLLRLERRCLELNVVVSAVRRSDRAWMVRVAGASTITSLVGRGPLDAVIAAALMDFEEAGE